MTHVAVHRLNNLRMSFDDQWEVMEDLAVAEAAPQPHPVTPPLVDAVPQDPLIAEETANARQPTEAQRRMLEDIRQMQRNLRQGVAETADAEILPGVPAPPQPVGYYETERPNRRRRRRQPPLTKIWLPLTVLATSTFSEIEEESPIYAHMGRTEIRTMQDGTWIVTETVEELLEKLQGVEVE